MPWKRFTSSALGVQWPIESAPAIDPYLVWADATDFAGLWPAFDRAKIQYTAESKKLARVPIAYELASYSIHQALDRAVRKMFPDSAWAPIEVGERFGTTQVTLAQLSALHKPPFDKMLARIELGLPTIVPAEPLLYKQLLTDSVKALADVESKDGLPQDEASLEGERIIAALIDDGCAFAHRSFASGLNATRIKRLWFQEDREPVTDRGRFLGYSGTRLAQFLATTSATDPRREAAAYEALAKDLAARGLPDVAAAWLRQMRKPATHGTHILDVMAGSPNPLAVPKYAFGLPNDAACAAPIIFVQLPRAAVADTSGASMNCHVLEALVYIAGALKKRDCAVINLSYGALAGPHDGTSLLEEAIDHWLAVTPKVRCLTLPAGNGYDSRTHARVQALPDAQWRQVSFQLLPADPTDSFVELWYEPRVPDAPGVAQIEIELIAPGGSSSGVVKLDECVGWYRDGGTANGLPVAAVIHLARPTAGAGRKCMALLAVAPTRGPAAVRTDAPHGEWKIRIRNIGGRSVPVDAWIERDDSAFGSGRSRSQATFLSEGARPARGSAHAATYPIVRDMCLNSFAHGERPKVAGGFSLRPAVGLEPGQPAEEVARYSASGPGRKGEHAGPDLCAPCEESPGIGLRAAGTRSTHPAYMDGTSVASAALARQLINRRCADPKVDPIALPPPKDHPGNIHLPDPALRRGRGRLVP